MAIQFLTGIPGAGKSLLAVKLLADELAHGNRHICTNLPLKLDNLEEWLIKKTGSSDRMRFLRILTDSECMQFWNHYGVGLDVQGRIEIKEGDRKITVPDFGARFKDGNTFPGTCFFIDEFHIFFPSRAWAKTGDDALHYQSQHRGMGDDVILISQHPEQCDKAMRRLCQDFTYLTNLDQTKVLGFSFPGWGRRATFAKETDTQPVETGTYQLPIKEYGGLYDTNAKTGGIVGRIDTKQKSAGGRSPLWIPVIVVAVALAIWFLPKLVFTGIGAVAKEAVSGLDASFKGTNYMAQPFAPKTNAETANLVVRRQESPAPAPVAPAAVHKPAEPLTIVRRVIVGPHREYWLSDGTRIRQGEPNVAVAAEDYVILQGGKVIWKK